MVNNIDSVSSDPPARTEEGTLVTLNISANQGYELETILVHMTGDETKDLEVSGSGDTRSFTMPDYDVTVVATFNETDEPVIPAVLSVTVSPASVNVQKGATHQFSATVIVEGGAAETVSWSVSGQALVATNINSTGLLTVAAAETAQTFTVTATSTEDITKSGMSTITVTSQSVTSTSELAKAIPLRAWTRNGFLHVTGLETGEVWSVYSV